MLLLVRNDIASLRRLDLESDLEMICVELNLKDSSNIVLSVVYRLPNSGFESIEKFEKFLDASTHIQRSKSVILGDFNFPNILWSNNCGFSQNTTESAYCECLKVHALFQMNTFPTHFTPTNNKGNILDLILTNEPDSISHIESISPTEAGYPTDHQLLEFDVNVHNRRAKNPDRLVYNFKAVDLDALKNDIRTSAALLDSIQYDNIDDCWLNWKSALVDIIDSHVPKIKAKDPTTP